ncbi:MAG: serine/threonine protein kinase [Actinobacteria bacterium]|nr:serine/threonine protein kinase [Actinomycetota bacterium]
MASPAIADLAGRVLAGRYRLLGSIGAGAAGRVYVADDVRLRRRVAVKVLHGALAEDPGFLRRFRSEAQHAASLHHPHIVAVYDWGEDGGMPFLVLELLRGGSLRALLDAGGRLSPSQAAHVGRQVAQALHHAHTRGVVHRDVKSSNLLFDEHGIVRVADFGLARALAEASWTEPDGGVVGTARYAAPEQASGAPVDGRADCYSLAVVLVESITGHVPNVGDSPVATVVSRTMQPLTVPDDLGALGDVLRRAGQPDPARRFPDAGTMAAALGAAARELTPPAPLVLPGLGEPVDDVDPTRIATTRSAAAAVGATAAVTAAAPAAASARPSTMDPVTAVFDQDTVVVDDEIEVLPRGRRERAPGTHRWVPMGVAAVIVLALVAVGALAASTFGGGGGGGSIVAPSLVGLDEEAAAARAAALGLRLSIERRESDDVAGLVIAQNPAAGSFLGDGGSVKVVVSRGPPPVGLPADLAGMPAAQAQARLEQLGFVVKVERAYDENVPVDAVIGTDPAAGAKVPRESEVVLRVSDGPAPVPVPSEVVGKTYDEAAAILKAKGFGVARADVFSDTVDVGKVVGTEPAVGTAVARGSTVTLDVSKGPEMVTVPDLRGKTVEAASQQLQALGLTPDVSNYGPGRPVRATDPSAGTQVKKGSKVTLFL